MTDNIVLDPITQKEFQDAVEEAFGDTMAEVNMEALSQIDFEEALFMLFLNGFYQGAVAMTENTDLRETLYMMTKEIDYQQKEK